MHRSGKTRVGSLRSATSTPRPVILNVLSCDFYPPGIALRLSHKSFRFGIRSILLLVTLLAILFAHVSWHRNLATLERAFELSAHAHADSPNAKNDTRFDAADSPCLFPGFLCRVLGGTKHHILALDLRAFDLGKHEIEQLSELSYLQLIYFPSDISPYEKELNEIDHLRTLYFDQTNASDQTVRAINRNQALKTLVLTKTNVSDESIPTLAEFSNLEHLVIRETRMSDSGVARLKSLLPRCQVDF